MMAMSVVSVCMSDSSKCMVGDGSDDRECMHGRVIKTELK